MPRIVMASFLLLPVGQKQSQITIRYKRVDEEETKSHCRRE